MYIPAEMESVAKSGLLPFFGCQGLHRLQIEVVIQMQIVEILSMDEQVQHVVALSTHLQNTKENLNFCPWTPKIPIEFYHH